MVLGLIGTIAIAIYLDWYFGIALLLYGIGVSLGLGYLATIVSEFLRTSSPKVVRCHYCGMKNPGDATFCIRCEKVLPKYKHRLPRRKAFEKI